MAAAVDSFISSAEVPDIISLTTKLSERLSELASGDSVPSSRRGSMNSNGMPSSLGAGAAAAGRLRSGAVTEENANMYAALANANLRSMLTSTLRPKADLRQASPAALAVSDNAARNERRRIALENARADRERYDKALKDPLVAGKTPEDRMQWGTALSALEVALENTGADPNSSEIRGLIDNRNRIRDEYLTPVSGGNGGAVAAAAGATKGLTLTPTPAQIDRNREMESKPKRSPPILYRRIPKKLNKMESIPNVSDEEEASENGGNAAAASSNSPNVAGFVKLNDRDKKEAIRIAKLSTDEIENQLLFSKPEIDKAVRELLAKAGKDSTNISTVIERLTQKGGARRRTAHQKHHRKARRLTRRR